MLWGLRPVQQQAAYGLAVERIKRQIHMGFIEPGERLPAERKLAEEVGLSRVTLREALRVLEAEGYISTRRGAHGGAFVAEQIILDDLAYKRLMLNPSNFMRVLEFREANEMTAAKLACGRLALPEFKRMKAALDVMCNSDTSAGFKSSISQFTLALGTASHNSFIEESIEHGLSQTFFPLHVFNIGDLKGKLLNGYQNVMTFIEAQDIANAQKEICLILSLYREIARKTINHDLK